MGRVVLVLAQAAYCCLYSPPCRPTMPAVWYLFICSCGDGVYIRDRLGLELLSGFNDVMSQYANPICQYVCAYGQKPVSRQDHSHSLLLLLLCCTSKYIHNTSKYTMYTHRLRNQIDVRDMKAAACLGYKHGVLVFSPNGVCIRLHIHAALLMNRVCVCVWRAGKRALLCHFLFIFVYI